MHDIVRRARPVADARGTGEPVAPTVLVTGIAGWLFGWLADRSGSLAAPMLAHLAINEAGAAAVLAVQRRQRLTRNNRRMATRRTVDPAKTRQALLAVADWLRDDSRPAPDRAELAAAVRLTARTLAGLAPGASVEVRIAPFVAVQCISGPRHTRGTPPNVVETDPRTWLLLAAGLLQLTDATATGALQLSGSRAGAIGAWLPLVKLGG
jgi:hypothetical protein